MTDSRQLLAKIVVLTRDLLQLAERSEWDRVRQLELQRAGLIADCFPLDESITRAEQAAAPIAEIIELDQRIVVLAARERQRLGDEIGKLQQGRQAANAYAEVGR